MRKTNEERKRQTTREEEGKKKDGECSGVLGFWTWSWRGMIMSMICKYSTVQEQLEVVR